MKTHTTHNTQKWIYGGLQQIGVGVKNKNTVWDFYKPLGFDIPMFNEKATAEIMAPYMGGKGWQRDAVFAINMYGGAGLEIWQFVDRLPQGMHSELSLANTGILASKIRCRHIHQLRQQLLLDGNELSQISYAPDGSARCMLKDNGNNWVILEETNNGWFTLPTLPKAKKHHSPRESSVHGYTGGVCGALIGVSNMDKSIEFYRTICGYDTVVYDHTKKFEDLTIFEGFQKLRRVQLTRSTPYNGLFSKLLGNSTIELVQAQEKKEGHAFKNRYWGDLGYIHLCFDVRGMDALNAYSTAQGHPFTIDTGTEFAMDDASGRFAYLEDPDGTLIEFVEVYKMPILKKYGLTLNVRKQKIDAQLPPFILKALAFRRTK